MKTPEIVIIGGGYTGALTAIHLAPHANVTIIEPNETPGRGLAYQAAEDHVLINVPAGKMRPFADKPNDFADWARGHGNQDPFPPRALFGRYVAARLSEQPHTHLRARAHSIARHGNQIAVSTDAGTRLADAVVLALGNPPPRPLTTLLRGLSPGASVIDDPGAEPDIPNDAPVLIVGTGLTMADVVAGLYAKGHRGPITAVSRRGLVPHITGEPPDARADVFAEPPLTAVGLLRKVRAEAVIAEREVGDWRRTIDEVRLALPAIWRQLSEVERDRLERHAGAAWNIHRYRMPPPVHRTLEAAIAAGRVRILAGRVTGFDGSAACVGGVLFPAVVAINCTGPDYAFRTRANPVLESLFSTGLTVRGARDNGLVLDDEDRVVGALTIFAAGPTARSRYGELTAASEIGHQVVRVAAAVLRAVENEKV